jgi:hypothetical protein
MHTRRLGRLTGATAQRLLDGGDGPSPLPQLLAAATTPATAAELLGEAAARAAFRSSTHSVPLPHDLPRRTPVRATSSIIIAKVIAAITLTAGTAGGITLATTSTPADPHHVTSESTGTGDAASSSLVVDSPTSPGALDDPEDLTGSGGTADAPAAGAPDATGGTEDAVRATPSPKAPHPTGRCRALSNISEDGQAGKAAESPAFADLSCTEADTKGGGTGSTRSTGRPDVPPGNPEQRTGKPDTAGSANDSTEAENKAGRTEKASKIEDASDGQAGRDSGGTADRGKSGEHRQDG